MNKKVTKKEYLEREYARQIKRIHRRLDTLESQGYKTGYVEKQIENKPKKITDATIRKLKKITPTYIRSHSLLERYDTGEVELSKSRAANEYYERIKEETPPAVEKIDSLDILQGVNITTSITVSEDPIMQDVLADRVIENFLYEFEGFPQSWYENIKMLVDDDVAVFGKVNVAIAITQLPQSFNEYVKTHKYGSDQYIMEYHSELVNYIPFDDKEAMSEELDYYEQ
ncbi:MAG: hypothetical protein NC311_10780 [Muribaculaceae bacterium]|nr:hypothetical protein [Muribaculaceae bacterium]